MEGPYRDLGSGFARLTGSEGPRRGPSRINTVEDALRELVRNARDAGARNIYVASALRGRRYRTLTVLDDGSGIPEAYTELIFEPGVTTRHLAPVAETDSSPHGAGLSLYHIRRAAVEAEVVHAASPTSIRVTFDTRAVPERALQSGSRPSKSNLHATLLALETPPGAHSPNLYLASPARILASVLNSRIIQTSGMAGVAEEIARVSGGMGLAVSSRTVQRILRGEILPVLPVSRGGSVEVRGRVRRKEAGKDGAAPRLALGDEEVREISAILGRSARSSYLEVGDLRVEARAGEIVLKAIVFEPEEEYE